MAGQLALVLGSMGIAPQSLAVDPCLNTCVIVTNRNTSNGTCGGQKPPNDVNRHLGDQNQCTQFANLDANGAGVPANTSWRALGGGETETFMASPNSPIYYEVNKLGITGGDTVSYPEIGCYTQVTFNCHTSCGYGLSCNIESSCPAEQFYYDGKCQDSFPDRDYVVGTLGLPANVAQHYCEQTSFNWFLWPGEAAPDCHPDLPANQGDCEKAGFHWVWWQDAFVCSPNPHPQ